jgi:hypothetical protein
MPSYVDFNASKSFRDFLITKTLTAPNGPQTFTATNYSVNNLNTFADIDSGAVDSNRSNDLLQSQNSNIFKPLEYIVNENFNTIARKANLNLYPYFVGGQEHNLVGIMNTTNYDTESELFKFAAWNIQNNSQGPFFARLQQNLYSSTVGKVRLIDALEGNMATAINLLTGKEPLVETNPRITVAKTIPGKAIDFLQTIAGVEFPWTEIPGDYLSNPVNPTIARPTATTEIGKTLQDITGVIGSLFGIQRRPTITRKPSDLFIEYMGERQKSTLFDNLSYSKYAPDYTTTARSQNTSKIFNFVDNFAQGAKNFLGIEAPKGVAYIGDDRGNDVKYAMNDFNDRPVKSSYYLGIMFDPVQAQLFQRIKNIGEGGGISGKLTWISSLSKNVIGANNSEFSSERSQFEESLSTSQTFRDNSILGLTQEILETMPTDGGASRSHVANVIDQTSRIFREGDVMMSKGSAIKYVDQYSKQESGVEYCRVWTKDRSYMNNSDTMKRTGTIRKFESSVLSAPWNLNIYPNSNGNGGFDTGSTNIARKGDGFYAKKYMFSLENLAWKLSNNPGFTYNDLPYCERGPNGGRIMWFPPYDLKISEQNAAKWEENVFLGRPEPVYTYQNTSRAGQVSFKVIVDHPSILNLLVKDHFKGMSDEEADNYINAFFAGCEDVDFYGLIRKYTTLTPNDVESIKAYLNENKDPKTVIRHQSLLIPPADKVVPKNSNLPIGIPVTLYFKNDYPLVPSSGLPASLYTDKDYQKLYDEYILSKPEYLEILTIGLDKIKNQPESQWTNDFKNDYELLTDIPASSKPSTEAMDAMITGVNAKIEEGFSKLITNYNVFTTGLSTLKTALSDNKVQNITVQIQSSTSSAADERYNLKLSYRRSYSIILDIINKIVKDGYSTSDVIAKVVWSDVLETDVAKVEQPITIPLKYFGYGQNEGNFIIEFVGNIGEQKSGDGLSSVDNVDCSDNNAILTSSELKKTAPITFCCRKSVVGIQYTTQDPDTEISQPPIAKRKLVEETDTPTGIYQTPPIDEIKKIIMKTLSECYYFKKLEEESPIQFSSLREKLRYFHPAFHSMTPEGLNARLTFLNQCVRPGDTLPIRGLSDESDLNARNTTFGPPPICVLRIGDFYHSKIIIRDVNITFDDNVWDLNPEGIGVQPMIANVQLQVNFIGGHGLEKPVERLQNALSSNFYANTEMYDPRATATEDRTQFYKQNFTKEFLDSINKEGNLSVTANPKDTLTTTDSVIQGSYIGTPGNSLDYTKFIDKSNESVYYLTESYFDIFRLNYDKVIKTYGSKLASIILSPDYRTIHNYTVQTGAGTETIELLGNYRKGYELERLLSNFKVVISGKTASENITSLMGFSNNMTSGIAARSETLLNPYVLKTVCKIIDDIPIDVVYMSILERKRNELIKTLDKLNFIIEYGYDGKVEKNVYTGANFTGYTYDIFYGAYSSAISFIKDNHSKFSEDLDTSYDFNGTAMTTDDLYYFLSILLRDYRKEILDLYTKDPIFTTKIQRNIEKKLDAFLTTEPESKNFGITRYPIRKNENKLLFGTTTEFIITDDVIKEKILNTHKTKGNSTTTTLNYYRSVYGTLG